MLRITQLKVPIIYSEQDLMKKAAKKLRIPSEKIRDLKLIRRSLDARKKPELCYVCTVDVTLAGGEETRILKGKKDPDINPAPKPYRFPYSGMKEMAEKSLQEGKKPPIVVGYGPAGMVCAYYLSLAGLKPLVIERGKKASERRRDVERFWKEGVLDPDSNVQFGEGGAGTFSDGKLNTLIKDKDGRCREVLSLFASMGAPEEICYDHKPHVGTDLLIGMVENLRKKTEQLGGQVLFETKMTGLLQKDGAICGIEIEGKDGKTKNLSCDQLVLAIGHSARDTFYMLQRQQIQLEAKAFAVGFRVIHPQNVIDLDQYGNADEKSKEALGAAAYKLTARTDSGRGVYSFCMCPGGYVVNSSSEPESLCINGMSYHDRNSGYANSAIIISIDPVDYPGGGNDPLSGIAFQRQLEKKAYEMAGGAVPVERYKDFVSGVKGSDGSKKSKQELTIEDLPVKGRWQEAPLHEMLPSEYNNSFIQAMTQFGKKLPGFDDDTVPLCGIESRTSSPVRILRGPDGQSQLTGLYPVGEGAGYAGGITSAAMDGLLAAERICRQYFGKEKEEANDD
ncbi:MAG: FAD-dependent oxidoreductase [Lachnospiraceae bacterium]|nr:FAD-dependent oxidoreductase [Lachnospiraceae bacterium]